MVPFAVFSPSINQAQVSPMGETHKPTQQTFLIRYPFSYPPFSLSLSLSLSLFLAKPPGRPMDVLSQVPHLVAPQSNVTGIYSSETTAMFHGWHPICGSLNMLVCEHSHRQCHCPKCAPHPNSHTLYSPITCHLSLPGKSLLILSVHILFPRGQPSPMPPGRLVLFLQ